MPEAQRALRRRAAAIEGLMAGMDAHRRGLADSGLPEVLLLEVEYEQAIKKAELDWIRDLLDRLDKGELDWAPTTPM